MTGYAQEVKMKDLSLIQEYMICAVNERGGISSLSTEKLVCLVAAGLLDLRLAELTKAVGRSLVDLELAQETRGGLLGNRKNFVPTKEAVEHVIDMVRAELLEDVEVTEDIVALVALLERGKCVKTYFSAYEQKTIKAKLKQIAAAPEGKLAGELIGYVENMMAIATGLIAVCS